MSDLISRTDAIDAVQKIVPYVIDKDIGQWEMLVNKANVITELSALPSAEAVHGEWLVKEKEDADGYYWWRECSNCGRKPLLDRWNRNEVLSAFCPYCGAKMTKGGDDE